MIRTKVLLLAEDAPRREIEPAGDDHATLRFEGDESTVEVYGTYEELLAFFNQSADLVVWAQARRDEERMRARSEMLFDPGECAPESDDTAPGPCYLNWPDQNNAFRVHRRSDDGQTCRYCGVLWEPF